MKHLIIIMCVALALMSCASTKKATSKVEELHSVDSIVMSESMVRKSLFDFDTTFAKDVSITITEIEYYPPGDDDKSKCNANAMQMQSKKPLRGGIRSIKQTSIDASVKGEGHTKVGDTLNVSKQQIQKRKEDKSNIKEHTATKRTLHWWYYVVLLGAIALLYITRAPILNFIRKILTGCRRIL